LPTETVYGLAADALNSIAVAKIFEAKERPRFDPLIVHLPNCEWLRRIAELAAGDRQLILKLADKFWPGPFTMVLPKCELVPDIVTAGLDTVAVRLSAHRCLLKSSVNWMTARCQCKPFGAQSDNGAARVG
jgi:L-threonylcarbamoyladenylate synthase